MQTQTIKLDRQTLDAIGVAIDKGMTRRMEMYDEVWLTGKQLCERFGMISKGWLEEYGKYIPRERMEVTDVKTGRVIASRYAYPLHRINRWIQEDRGHVAIMLNEC
jgi:hypothetical protein